METATDYDLVGNIIAYEAGELDNSSTLLLFSHLVKSGQAWTLQGHYGRQAMRLIDAGYLDAEGNIRKEFSDVES